MTPWHQDEPTLAEMFQEPIIRQVMSRDAVEQDDLVRLLDRLRTSYRAAALARRAH
jgi:hypothetical protein